MFIILTRRFLRFFSLERLVVPIKTKFGMAKVSFVVPNFMRIGALQGCRVKPRNRAVEHYFHLFQATPLGIFLRNLSSIETPRGYSMIFTVWSLLVHVKPHETVIKSR